MRDLWRALRFLGGIVLASAASMVFLLVVVLAVGFAATRAHCEGVMPSDPAQRDLSAVTAGSACGDATLAVSSEGRGVVIGAKCPAQPGVTGPPIAAMNVAEAGIQSGCPSLDTASPAPRSTASQEPLGRAAFADPVAPRDGEIGATAADPQPQPAVALEFRLAGIVAHDVASGWHHPLIFAAECVLGPRLGPIYLAGACATQINGIGAAIPIATYVGQGKILHGWFRGFAVQVGYRQQSIGDNSKRSLYFGMGAAR